MVHYSRFLDKEPLDKPLDSLDKVCVSLYPPRLGAVVWPGGAGWLEGINQDNFRIILLWWSVKVTSHSEFLQSLIVQSVFCKK